jgi:3-hydroxyacyl-CoA dehydrogenase/enoyl-CoA hydratase/3-hydroxybutyryl-CoA epimerase
LLYIQALETVQTMQDGVLISAAEGDIGCILGLGYPPYTGGPLSLIDTVGVERFVSECKRLAKKYGERFAPPKLLKKMAKEGKRFH